METTRLGIAGRDVRVVADDNDDEDDDDSSSSLDGDDGIATVEAAAPSWQNIQSHWKIVVAGQCISLLIVCGGATQSTLSLRCHLSSPAFTTGLYYAGLAGFLIPLYRRRQHSRIVQQEDDDGDNDIDNHSVAVSRREGNYLFLSVISLEAPAWVYTIMAVLDVYASYFTVMAFKYTTITSVSLLTALAVPSTMILSFLCLNRRFTAVHFVGVSLCLCGIMVNVLQDYKDDRNTSLQPGEQQLYPHKFRGDIMAILGGFLYGANDVLGEVAVRKLGGPHEYLGMLGFFATLICTFQTLVFEREEAGEFFRNESCSNSSLVGLVVAFAGCNVLAYAAGARFLQVSEATFFNLSIQTGGLWSVLFSVAAEHIVPKPRFFVALVLTVAGVCVYEMAPTPVLEDRENERVKVDGLRHEHQVDLELSDEQAVYTDGLVFHPSPQSVGGRLS